MNSYRKTILDMNPRKVQQGIDPNLANLKWKGSKRDIRQNIAHLSLIEDTTLDRA